MLAPAPNKAGHRATIKIITPRIVSVHLQLQLNIFYLLRKIKAKSLNKDDGLLIKQRQKYLHIHPFLKIPSFFISKTNSFFGMLLCFKRTAFLFPSTFFSSIIVLLQYLNKSPPTMFDSGFTPLLISSLERNP